MTGTPKPRLARIVAVTVGTVLLVLAGIFAYLPVPAQHVSGIASSEQYVCGPPATYEPGLVLWFNPDVITEGAPSDATDQASVEAETDCLGAAAGHLHVALGLSLAGTLILAGFALLSLRRRAPAR